MGKDLRGERHVAQPPSAGSAGPPSSPERVSENHGDGPSAKPAEPMYRRNLPHIQPADKTLYVTFCTYRRWVLPESVRTPVLRHCLHDLEIKCQVHVVLVMPDHVHMIFRPGRDVSGAVFGLAEIMNGIKGTSSHMINKVLKKQGRVWQDESWDHVLRADEYLAQKVEYVLENPVRKMLVGRTEDWPWRWVEGMPLPR